jgi:hypothetical protein
MDGNAGWLSTTQAGRHSTHVCQAAAVAGAASRQGHLLQLLLIEDYTCTVGQQSACKQIGAVAQALTNRSGLSAGAAPADHCKQKFYKHDALSVKALTVNAWQ